jgi:hypothetical protein
LKGLIDVLSGKSKIQIGSIKSSKKSNLSFSNVDVNWRIKGSKKAFDLDRDGVIDRLDCKPLDPKRQDARWNKEIGMFSIDRPKKTCKHMTPFCATTCYNIKEYRAFGKPRMIRGKMVGMELKDVKNEEDWQNWSGVDWRQDLTQKSTKGKQGGLRKKPISIRRVRLMARGEAFSNAQDVERVKQILKHNPQTMFWIPTRAWHDATLKAKIEREVERFPNVRILWSTDPSDFETGEYKKTRGHSTMFYGDDSLNVDPLGRRFFKCPKSWQKLKGYCAVCKDGCFSNREVHVHMKQH